MDTWMIVSLALGGVNTIANIGEAIACGMINSKAEAALDDADEAKNIAMAARQMAYNAANAANNNNNVPPVVPPAGSTDNTTKEIVFPADYDDLKKENAEFKAKQQTAAIIEANKNLAAEIANAVAASMKDQFQGIVDSINSKK